MSNYNVPWRLVPNRVRGAGGREIDKLRGVEPPVDDHSGSEAWIGSTTRAAAMGGTDSSGKLSTQGCAEVDLPDGRRVFLFEAIAENPSAVLGAKHLERHGENLGVLIKYLDAKEPYLLQAHPTRAFAKQMWDSDFGKEESWYIIGLRDDVEEPPFILLGFKEGVTRELVEKYYYADDVKALENLCHKVEVKIGETYFVGGGVPHALGAGCFVVEVQEPSDITVVPFRMSALAKMFAPPPPKPGEPAPPPRPARPEPDPEAQKLYDERSLGAFIYDGCSESENLRRWRIPQKTIREGGWGKEYYLIGPEQTSYFAFSRLDLNGSVEVLSPGVPRVGIVLEGAGTLKFDGGTLEVKRGDELFLPYDIPGLTAEGELSLVLCYPEGTPAL
ncbi:MAG: class I mannose-6-phosphate isomerase [Oscillospiraceae bacterium]|jgi:mannose-6-phosphate isomerase|nr:class I mannose-6-phosphate isomerase [Oscillospiraceae bacterium]